MIDDQMEKDIEQFLAEVSLEKKEQNSIGAAGLQDEEMEKIIPASPVSTNITPPPVASGAPLTEEETEKTLIEMILDDHAEVSNIILNLKGQVIAGKDPGLIDAMSKLIDTNNKKLDLLTKLTIANKKNRSSKEITQIKMANKVPQNMTQNNIIVGSREEIFKKIRSIQPDSQEGIVVDTTQKPKGS